MWSGSRFAQVQSEGCVRVRGTEEVMHPSSLELTIHKAGSNLIKCGNSVMI